MCRCFNDMIRIPVGVPYGCKSANGQSSDLLLVSSSTALEKLISEIGTPSDHATATEAEPDTAKVAAAGQNLG